MVDAKEYLKQIKYLDARIDSMLDTLEGLKAQTVRITQTIKQDVVTGGGSQDRMAESIAKIVDLEEEINRKIDYFVDEKAKALRLLEKMRNPDYLLILQKRYIDYKTFEQIAQEMNYTHRWICKLHGRALQVFAKVLEAEGGD